MTNMHSLGGWQRRSRGRPLRRKSRQWLQGHRGWIGGQLHLPRSARQHVYRLRPNHVFQVHQHHLWHLPHHGFVDRLPEQLGRLRCDWSAQEHRSFRKGPHRPSVHGPKLQRDQPDRQPLLQHQCGHRARDQPSGYRPALFQWLPLSLRQHFPEGWTIRRSLPLWVPLPLLTCRFDSFWASSRRARAST